MCSGCGRRPHLRPYEYRTLPALPTDSGRHITQATVEMAQEAPSPLLALPAELRIYIYELTLDVDIIRISGNTISQSLSVLNVCRQIRQEVTPIMCQHAVFYSLNSDYVFDFLTIISATNRKAIREIHVDTVAEKRETNFYHRTNTGFAEQDILDTLVKRLRLEGVELKEGVLLASVVSDTERVFWSTTPATDRRHLTEAHEMSRTLQRPSKLTEGSALRSKLAWNSVLPCSTSQISVRPLCTRLTTSYRAIQEGGACRGATFRANSEILTSPDGGRLAVQRIDYRLSGITRGFGAHVSGYADTSGIELHVLISDPRTWFTSCLPIPATSAHLAMVALDGSAIGVIPPIRHPA